MAFLERNANRGSISTGYDIDNSLKVQANSGNEWFYRNSPTAGNKRTFTFSFWIKRTQLDGYEADPYLMSQGSNARFHFAGHTLRFMFDGGSTEMEAAGKLRDTHAWYHIVLAIDTTQSTNTNRVKAYVNGESYAFNNNDWPSQNQESSWMSGTNMYFNTRDGDGSYDNSGYWAEVAVVDGQALAPTSFGEYNDDGIWIPKDLSDITFGNEGFYLKFDDASDIGADSSGNNNNVTLNNITSADLATDTPTNNFCTMSPIINFRQKQPVTKFCTNGATFIQDDSSNSWRAVMGSVFLTKGKWYWEVKNQWSTNGLAGIHTFRGDSGTTTSPQAVNDSFYFVYNKSGSGAHMAKYIDGTGTNPVGSYETAFNHNDYACFSLDLDNDTLTVTQNGSSAGSNLTDVDISSITALGPVAPFMGIYRYSMRTIFGGFSTDELTSPYQDGNGYGNFKYAVPSGFYAICTKNLAEYG